MVEWRLIKILMSFGHRVRHLYQKGPIIMPLVLWLTIRFCHGWPCDPGLSKQWHFLEEFPTEAPGKLISLWPCGLKKVPLSLCLAMDWTYGNSWPERMKPTRGSRAGSLWEESKSGWREEREEPDEVWVPGSRYFWRQTYPPASPWFGDMSLDQNCLPQLSLISCLLFLQSKKYWMSS